jgi:hypothetical protein
MIRLVVGLLFLLVVAAAPLAAQQASRSRAPTDGERREFVALFDSLTDIVVAGDTSALRPLFVGERVPDWILKLTLANGAGGFLSGELHWLDGT